MTTAAAENLSDLQRKAVLDDSERILVAAGAGSGKTRLLVAYFVRALVDEDISPERLVAVTFTRKAAAELTARIRGRLEELQRPDLALALDEARVGTIHSLCAGLLRDHPLEAGVDPAFSVLDADAAALVEREVLDEIWAQAVEAATETELDTLGSHTALLREEVIPLYRRLRSMGEEHPQVTIPRGSAVEETSAELVQIVQKALEAGKELPRITKSLAADLDRLERCFSWIEAQEGEADSADQLRVSEAYFPTRMTSEMEPFFGPVRAALTSYRLSLAEQQLQPVVDVMNQLLARFHSAYTTYKRARSLLDFPDLELYARGLLHAEGRPKMGLGGQELWVMIDEFQDTNELQCAILEGLAASRFLMVGDERQSIYRFRGADVEVFRRREISAGRQGEAIRVHRLDVNYRSRAEILAFINRLFAHESFFGSRFVELRSGNPQPVSAAHERCGSDRMVGLSGARAKSSTHASSGTRARTGSGGSNVAVELVAVDRLEKPGPDAQSPPMQEAEALVVAASVRRMLDEEGWEPRDIAVLTPAQTRVDLYHQALLDVGVDVYVVGGKGYYSRDEITDLTALLGLLVNPHNDIALVTVLRSPVVGLSDDGLYLIGRQARNDKAESLWDAVRDGKVSGLSASDQGLLEEFVERLSILRRRVGRPGLARLLDDAVSACGYDVCLLAADKGIRRFANVRKLMRIADDYESLQGPDLAGFVEAIESMGDLSDKEGSAPTLAEGENVVRLMTVHQAKGLEFPVVILAGLGSDAPRSARSRFISGGDGRIGVVLKGSGHKTYEFGDLAWGPVAEIVAEETIKDSEEDLRLLYVAMTRAEERLVLVGAKPKGQKLEVCRLGRMALALGLDALPEAGTAVSVDGLDAVVIGALPDGEEQLKNGEELQSKEKPDGEEGFAPELARGPRGRMGLTPVQQASADRDGADGLMGPCSQFLACGSASMVPRQTSFSALALYLSCPKRFYLERMLGLRFDPIGALLPSPSIVEEPGEPSAVGEDLSSTPEEVIDEGEIQSGRTVGLIVHALLERHSAEQECPEFTLLSEEVDVLAGQFLGEMSLSPADRARVLSLTRAFWDSPFARDQALGAATREGRFIFALADTVISGVMDLAWSVEQVWHIVDYKTNTLDGRAPGEVAANYDLQATIYALAAFRAGADKVSMDFLFLERPDCPVSLSFDRSDEPRLESVLESVLDEMRQTEFQMRPGKDCAWCSAALVCAGMAGSQGHGIE